MKVSALQDQLINALVRRHGGTVRHWRMALGPIRVYDATTHPHCNWSAAPSGRIHENEAVEQLLDELRLVYPMVEKG